MPRSSETRVESARSSSNAHGARGSASRGGHARRGFEDSDGGRSPRGRSAREGAPSRDRADHAARARVGNTALERDARRVGALELDHARRAGLCVIVSGGLARRGVEDNPQAKGHCLVSLEFPRRRCRTDRPLTSRPRERRSTRAASRGSRSAPSRGRRREKRRRDRVDSAATIDERHRRAPRGGGFGASEGTRA